MKVRNAVLAALAVPTVALAVTACGNDSNSPEESNQAKSPKTVIAEVGATKKGLRQALDAYSGGNQAAAVDQAMETYLQHFELVEGPLEEVDPGLTEELEDAIREGLVDAMKAGDSVSDVTTLVDEINADLADASRALQGS